MNPTHTIAGRSYSIPSAESGTGWTPSKVLPVGTPYAPSATELSAFPDRFKAIPAPAAEQAPEPALDFSLGEQKPTQEAPEPAPASVSGGGAKKPTKSA